MGHLHQPMGYGIWVNSILQPKGTVLSPLYSWCSAFDPNTHIITNKLKTACVWTGWGLWETQKVILNMSCSNHSSLGEGDPKRRVSWCSPPKLRVDVTPWSKSNPRPSVTVCLGKREPQMTVAYIFIEHTKPAMMYTDDTRTSSLNVECHHGLWAWEMSGGKPGMLIAFRHMRITLQNKKFNYPG